MRHAHRLLAIFMPMFAGLLMMPNPAQAASCGGIGEKACPAWKKGPQCGDWLTKDSNKI